VEGESVVVEVFFILEEGNENVLKFLNVILVRSVIKFLDRNFLFIDLILS